jgi:hypothetical protein
LNADNRQGFSHRVADDKSLLTDNRQGFSHRVADDKSLLDERFAAGWGERDAANGRSERGECG